MVLPCGRQLTCFTRLVHREASAAQPRIALLKIHASFATTMLGIHPMRLKTRYRDGLEMVDMILLGEKIDSIAALSRDASERAKETV